MYVCILALALWHARNMLHPTLSAVACLALPKVYTLSRNQRDLEKTIHSLVFSLEGRAWQEPESSHVTIMALAHCILGKFLGVVCHCFPLPLDVPTLAARCLRPQ